MPNTYTPPLQTGQAAFNPMPTAPGNFSSMPPAAPAPKLTSDQFAQTIKAKYPAYANVDNNTLTQKVLAKYPQYASKVNFTPPPAPTPTGSAGQSMATKPGESLMGDLSQIAGKVVNATGFGTTADTLGTDLARATNPNAAKVMPAPSLGKQAGAALNLGSLAFPVGAAEKVGAGALAKILPSAAAKVGGKVLAMGTAGYGLDAAQKLENGQAPTPGLNTAIGAALPLPGAAMGALKAGAGKISQDMAPRIINSLIKPLQKDFAYGKNAGRTISQLGITANNLEDLGQKVSQARQTIGQSIGKLGDSLEGRVELKLQSSLKPLDDAIETAVAQRNQAAVTRLQEARKALTETSSLDNKSGKIVSTGTKLLDNATFKTARSMLGQIGDMTQFTGNPSDDKLVNSALKRVYGNIKEQTLNAAHSVNPELAGKLRTLTEQYSDLTTAQIATEYRHKITQRQNLIGLSPTLAGLGTGIATAVATGGAAIPALLAGGAGAGVDKALGSTAFKTRAAAVLAKVPKAAPAAERSFQSPGDMLLKGIGSRLPKTATEAQRGFAKVPGVPADIHPDDLSLMHQFIDHARVNGPLSDEKFAQTEKLAQHFGISMDKGINGVANQFEKVLTGAKKVPGTVVRQLRDDQGRFQSILPKKKP